MTLNPCSILTRATAAALIALLCPIPRLAAQAAAAVQSPAPTMLHINILEGEGALNNISTRTAREPIIQVEDQNHKPVAGATVLFTIHSSANEAGASFATPFSQSNTLTMTTDAEGKAIGHGLTPNAIAGQLTVTVQATLGAVATTAVIHMINSLTTASAASASTSASAAANSGSAPASSSSTGGSTATSSGTVTSSTGSIASGGASTGASGGLLHIFHLLPKWAVVGGVTGVAATAAIVTVIVVTNSGGATISAGTGTVTGPH